MMELIAQKKWKYMISQYQNIKVGREKNVRVHLHYYQYIYIHTHLFSWNIPKYTNCFSHFPL